MLEPSRSFSVKEQKTSTFRASLGWSVRHHPFTHHVSASHLRFFPSYHQIPFNCTSILDYICQNGSG